MVRLCLTSAVFFFVLHGNDVITSNCKGFDALIKEIEAIEI
nr:MAG TPA: hypothetical protein [Crassvirales sp.]